MAGEEDDRKLTVERHFTCLRTNSGLCTSRVGMMKLVGKYELESAGRGTVEAEE